jgi:aspartate/methionine/tyrosine aminotransferase
MRNYIANRVTRLVRMTMADMADLADQRPSAFRLENADAYLPPAEHVLQATRTAVGEDRHNSYLPLRGLSELRQAVAARYSQDYGLDYDPETEIVITSGAGEAMLDALLTLVNPGEKVLLTNPTYSGMAQRVKLVDGVPQFTDLVEEQGWHLDTDHFTTAAEGCVVIFYASPCMPTGTVFTPEETELIARTAQENDAVVLFNAVLDKVVYDGQQVVHPATLPEMRERTVTVGAVSKNYNMMGWRIGWLAGPKELIRPMEDVHIFNGLMPNGFAQAGAAAALSGSQDWQREIVDVYARQRDALIAALAGIPGLTTVRPAGGYFFLGNISKFGVPSPAFCRDLLAATEVAITPMVAWGRDDFGYQHVRFIFTNEPENRLHEAAARIRSFVEQRFGG